MRSLFSGLSLGALLLSPTVLHAQAYPTQTDPMQGTAQVPGPYGAAPQGTAAPQGAPPEWAQPQGLTIDIGPAVIMSSRYPGAAATKVRAVPNLRLDYKGIVFASAQEGLGVNAIRTKKLKAGPVVKLEFGRQGSETARYLPGLAKVDATAGVGGFVHYDVTRALSLKLDAVQAIGGHEGFVANASIGWGTRFKSGTILSMGPRLKYTDARYNRAFFGVTPAQVPLSGLTAYAPGAGFSEASFGGAVIQPVAKHITVTGFASYGRLLGSVARSPIVTGSNGSADQVSVGAGLSYRFRVK